MKSWFRNTHNDEAMQITRNLKKKHQLRLFKKLTTISVHFVDVSLFTI